MLKITRLAIFAFLGAMATGVYADDAPAASKSAGKTAATVNGVAIPQERLDMLAGNAASQGKQDTPELRKALLEQLENNELAVQEALKRGLDKKPEFTEQMDMVKRDLLANALIQDYMKSNPVSDEEVVQEYNKLKEALGGKEYHPFHILVDSEKEAQSIAAKLKKGGKFEALAKRYSKDAGSKENGGDIGWIPVGKISMTYVKPFGDALLNLSKGQVSEPVQSQFGWHVIKLGDVRDLKMPTVEELKPRIVQAVQQQGIKKLVADLRSKAKIAE